MLQLSSRASGEQSLVFPVEQQLPFYLEKVGLSGELVAELLHFLFRKAGEVSPLS